MFFGHGFLDFCRPFNVFLWFRCFSFGFPILLKVFPWFCRVLFEVFLWFRVSVGSLVWLGLGVVGILLFFGIWR